MVRQVNCALLGHDHYAHGDESTTVTLLKRRNKTRTQKRKKKGREGERQKERKAFLFFMVQHRPVYIYSATEWCSAFKIEKQNTVYLNDKNKNI